MRWTILLLTIGLLAGCKGGPKPPPQTKKATAAQPGANTALSDLPPSRVVMYQNGVGYIERRGKVNGDTLKLRVRPEQINDILKSLTVIDMNDGKAVSISLPIQKSADRLAKELPKAIREQGGMLAILATFRGASVTVKLAGRSAKGRIVGVEKQTESTKNGGTTENWRVTLLTDGGELTSHEVSKVTSVSLHDKTLDVGLRQSLDISLDAGAWKPVELEVKLKGANGAHNLMVSYIVEMPVWKPSYRLVTGKDGKALIQGWAIVDNVTGEDWKDINLSLVAGEPLSFTYDLHTPRFRPRQHLSPRTRTASAIPVDAKPSPSRYGYAKKRSRKAAGAEGRYGIAPSVASAGDMAKKDEDEKSEGALDGVLADRLRNSVQTLVSGTKVGALFRYDIAEKVSVPDRSATMVSILSKDVPGQDVHIFRPTYRAFSNLKPYRAIKFENKTGFSLEEGPIALYSGGTFVGEGYLSRIEPGRTVFVPYAVDGEVTLSAKRKEKEEAVGIVKIVDGKITSQTRRVTSVTYEIDNKRDEPVTAWVRRGKRAGWSIRKPAKGILEVGGWNYVQIKVAANSKAEVTVEEMTPVTQSISIHSRLSVELIKIYLGSQSADKLVKGQLAELLKVKKELAGIAREKATLTKTKSRFESNQARLRKNLKLLNETKGNVALKRQLTKKLAEDDKEISKINGTLVKLDGQEAGARAKLSELLNSISLNADK